MILLKFECDYADEFDVYGFEVISEERWQAIQVAIADLKYPCGDFYFGTNEGIIFESAQELRNSFEAIEITEDEVKVLEKCFKKFNHISYGWIPTDIIIDKAR